MGNQNLLPRKTFSSSLAQKHDRAKTSGGHQLKETTGTAGQGNTCGLNDLKVEQIDIGEKNKELVGEIHLTRKVT